MGFNSIRVHPIRRIRSEFMEARRLGLRFAARPAVEPRCGGDWSGDGLRCVPRRSRWNWAVLEGGCPRVATALSPGPCSGRRGDPPRTGVRRSDPPELRPTSSVVRPVRDPCRARCSGPRPDARPRGQFRVRLGNGCLAGWLDLDGIRMSVIVRCFGDSSGQYLPASIQLYHSMGNLPFAASTCPPVPGEPMPKGSQATVITWWRGGQTGRGHGCPKLPDG